METRIHMALVDDEADVEIIYKTMLRKEISSGLLSLHFFLEGKTVLEFLRTDGHYCQILILVSDINMPNMTGITLIEHVNKEFPHIDLYLSSAYDYESTIEEAKNSNVKGYFEKPVDFDRVKRIIHEKEDQLDNQEVA
jgi:DNA-binding NtrC family response regulator